MHKLSVEPGRSEAKWLGLLFDDSSHMPVPAVPDSFEQAGVAFSLVQQIAIKLLHNRGDALARDLAGALGLKFRLVQEVLDDLKAQHLIEVKRSTGAGFIGDMNSIFSLTDSGRERARLYLEINQYAGPVPVPLKQYTELVLLQRPPNGWLSFDALKKAYAHIVVTQDLLWQLGPAINSGSSFLIYGKPGDGKTYLAEGMADLHKQPVFLPHAIEYQGNIMQVYDPVYHVPFDPPRREDGVDDQPAYDGRWLRCKRPFIVSGGELTMDTLELSYNPVSKVYEAPLQTKANNGIYLVDDFGRQKITPAELLNRWIVPMERRTDYLRFHTGGKMTVPFETFLVFSTNLIPDQLGDEAFLRRIHYKLFVPSPEESEFCEIFRRCCALNGFVCSEKVLDRFIQKHYRAAKKPFRRCHPRDVISHAIDLIEFGGRSHEITEDLLDHAYHNCFVREEGEAAFASPLLQHMTA
jgi:hypothetical protein